MNVNNAKYTKSQPSKPTTAEDFLPKKNKEQKQQKIFKLSAITLTNYTGKKQTFTTTKFTLISIRLEEELHLEYPYCRPIHFFTRNVPLKIVMPIPNKCLIMLLIRQKNTTSNSELERGWTNGKGVRMVIATQPLLGS